MISVNCRSPTIPTAAARGLVNIGIRSEDKMVAATAVDDSGPGAEVVPKEGM